MVDQTTKQIQAWQRAAQNSCAYWAAVERRENGVKVREYHWPLNYFGTFGLLSTCCHILTDEMENWAVSGFQVGYH